MRLLLFLIDWLGPALPWLAPLTVSSLTGGVVGYGSFRFAQGSTRERITTLEKDVVQVREGCSGFVTRNEFDLIRDDLRDIKQDVREVRRSLTK